MAVKIKPISLIPYDQAISPQTIEALNAAVVGINQLIGQAALPPGQGIQSLSLPTVDPKTGQIISGGIRTGSITTPLLYIDNPTFITFYWDGTTVGTGANTATSIPFQIFRDDGTVTPATKVGSPLVISNLPRSTDPFFFYPYWDENAQQIKFVTNNNSTIKGAVGTPAYAFQPQNIFAAQQQILRGHIPLAPEVSTTGINTPTAGPDNPASGGSGGGSGGGIGHDFPSVL